MFEQVKIKIVMITMKDGKIFKPGEEYNAQIWANYFRVEKSWNAPRGYLIPKENAEVIK